MARGNRGIRSASRNIQDTAKAISANMDAIYRSTYMSSPQQSKDLENLNNQINTSIDRIVNRNMETVGLPSVTKLYSRIDSANKSSNDFVGGLQSMFDGGIIQDDVYSMFSNNRYLKELDREIDTVCRYMPQLEEALAVQKDCVLSADHFAKDFLSFEYPGSGVDETLFNERAKDLKKKYELPKLVDEIYDDTSKYGEKFIYRVPYKTAIGKLLATKPEADTLISPFRGLNESVDDFDSENECYVFSMNESISSIKQCSSNSRVDGFTESVKIMKESVEAGSTVSSNTSPASKSHNLNIGIEICKSGIIESAVREYQIANKKKTVYSAHSMSKLHEQQMIHEAEEKKDIKADGGLKLPPHKKDSRIIGAGAIDGLIAQGQRAEPVKVDVKGCVVKKLKREFVTPIYIEDICMGYYYFELRTLDESESFMGYRNMFTDPTVSLRNDSRTPYNYIDVNKQDECIRYVSSQLSKFIDKQFVNNNQDLTKEIYMILKSNDLLNTPCVETIKVTFIPPEDMVHFYFKMDPITHRGISDLEKALVPAKIYCTLYITNAIGNLTRGQDKRVYYVKQTVDTNIAQTLLNTINQIKKGNFGIRQFESINNVLNITGRFNDYIIPTNASGEAPIQFEVMPGQEINTPTELMEQLKDMAINSTGIPIEIIEARQSVDYALQLTMSNSKVLRFCYKRQELFEDMLSELISPIYNYEYDESTYIKITLPPPSFINITNTNQLVDNTKNFVQSIVDMEMANEQDEKLKAIYTNELFKHYLGTHLDTSAHENILHKAKIMASKDTPESHSDGQNDYQ